MAFPEIRKGDPWPPEGHSQRIQEYAKYRQLFKGKHQEVYDRVQRWLDQELDKSIVYIVCNFAGLISKVSADLLFGEMPRFIVGEPGSQEQAALDGIVQANSLQIRNYEMAISASWRGDCLFSTRFGKMRPYDADPMPIITATPTQYFFPHLDGDDINVMTGATLGWEKNMGDKTYLRLQIHEPGLIRNELWELGRGEIGNRVPLSTFDEYTGLRETEDTKYLGLLVEYAPNWALDDEFWGISDYLDLESLFDELNNRVSRISRVLDKHESPKLILPPGMMKYDPKTQRWYVEKDALDVVEVDTQEAKDLPKYLVWDAQLEAAFKQIEKLLELLFLTSEISPDTFGFGKERAAESGRALKFRLMRTLGKINRKKLYFDRALKNALYAAQVLDVQHGSGKYEPKPPHIEWQDGLPQDAYEAAQIEEVRANSGTTSRESAIRRLDGLEGEALQKELERIKAENPAAVPDPTKPRVQLPPGPSGGS